MNKPLRIAVAGLGTVGGGVASVLLTRGKELEERAGRTLELVGVSARDKAKSRTVNVSKIAWENDARALVKSDADVIVELIGGEEGIAYDLVKSALVSKKHVVTANKALLAYHGAELAALAEENNVALKFEAAAAGGIPIVKALRESLIAYGIDSVRGILNGTCNYILTQMEATGQSFADVLKEAQKLGYAEADPTLDVGGGDTAHKLAVLSALAFGVTPNLKSMKIEGIEHITPDDIRFVLGLHGLRTSKGRSTPSSPMQARRDPSSSKAAAPVKHQRQAPSSPIWWTSHAAASARRSAVPPNA